MQQNIQTTKQNDQHQTNSNNQIKKPTQKHKSICNRRRASIHIHVIYHKPI